MGSTNRGHERHVSDYYVTKVDHIEKFLVEFREDYHEKLEGLILDPCAGGNVNPINITNNKGKTIQIMPSPMSYPVALANLGYSNIVTCDLREDSLAEIKMNFLDWKEHRIFDLVITNPPFFDSLAIVNKAFQVVKPDGVVVMLQKLNWLGTIDRYPWWKQHMPTRIYVDHKRMGFIPGSSKADSIEYAHFVWDMKDLSDRSLLYLV